MSENPLITALRESRDAKQTELDKLLEAPTSEKRNLSDTESTTFNEIREALKSFDERIAELVELDQRKADANEARKAAGVGGALVTDAPVYARNKVETSYFRDVYLAQRGDRDAADRLQRSNKATADQVSKRSETELRKLGNFVPNVAELRALGNTGGAGGSGGEFAPPLWLIEDFIAYARPGRKFLDSLNPKPLPAGVSSINLPAVTGGTTTAIQTTQNSALSQTDMTTSSVSSTISTIGGKQVVSLQLLQQSGIPFDEVVLQDLAADYAKQADTQAISGSGTSGQMLGVGTYFTASGTVNITYTQATPAVGGAGGLYSKIFAAASAIESARYLPPDTVWMHPRRWNWILASSDTANRPLVNPSATAWNVVATSDGVGMAQGVVGKIGALDVITDANIPTNTGGGTNQDPIYVGVRGDLRAWESPLQTQTFDATYADSAGVLFRVLAYLAAIPKRYTTSIAVVNGTGLVTPAF